MKTFNLDDENEVADFIRDYSTIKGRHLANMLEFKGFGAVKKANDLSNYAWNKYTAINLRRDGMISSAAQYEKICDSIYIKMHSDIKW